MRRLLPLLFALCVFAACNHTKESVLQRDASVVPSGETATLGAAKPLSYAEQRLFDRLFLESLRQKEAEHNDAQFELLSAALEINPNAPEAIYEMGVLRLTYSPYSDSQSLAEGDSLLRRAVALMPDNLHFKETLATYLANRAEYREAISIYEEIADTQPSEELFNLLIWLYKSSGDYAGAIRTIERLEQTEGTSEKLSLEKFQTYIAMKDDEHAYKAIEDLCAEYPLDLRYRVLLGDLYDHNGYHENALDIYLDVLAAEPDNSYAQISLLAYYKKAQADSLYLDLLNRVVMNPRTQSSARLEAMRAYALDNLETGADSLPVLQLFHRVLAQPQETRDMAELMASYVIQRQMPTDSVVAAMERILEIEPDYTQARLQMLEIAIQQKDLDRVLTVCREGELYEPSEILYYYYEGSALYLQGHDMEAIKRLQDGAGRIDDTTDPQTASDVLSLLGDVLYDHGLKEEAYSSYDRALDYNPNNLLCLNNYAYYLSLQGKELEKAERMSKQTVDAEGDSPTYLDTYAWVLYLQGKYPDALAYIKEALRYVTDIPSDATLYDHAGDISYRSGDRAQALEWWKKAASITDDRSLKAKALRKVRRRRI